jgi:purine catabolism regulator
LCDPGTVVTVDRLLSERSLDLTGIHLPHGDRALRWVATSELDDPTPYLLGGELLLTTGLGTKRWTTRWGEYVARLKDADVAALGLGVGLTHDAAPAALVEACRRDGLNLLTVPRPTAFVAVSRTVAALLDDEAEHAARAALEAQRLLTRAALRGDDAAILRQLGGLVGGTVAVVDDAGTAAALVGRPGSTTVVHPLGVGARPSSWLTVTTAGPLDDAHRSAVSMAVSLLTLALERRREGRARDRALRRRALDLLLHGDPDTASLLLESVDAAAVPPGPLRVLRVRGPGDTLEDLLADLETEPVLAARVGDELVVVSADRRAGGTGQRLVAGGARVGVGPSVAVADLAHSHDGAEHALTALPDAPVAAWDDLMRGGVLALLGTGASAYADEFLAPLGDDPALLATLGAYLDHHGSVGETAAALAVHRNTVRNRLRQVEAALGRSLDDPHVRVDAWVAVQALRTR